MTKQVLDSRRNLRERAFQALFSLEFGQELTEAVGYAYSYHNEEEQQPEIPVFLLNLVKGTVDEKETLDKEISAHLKKGWSLERLTATDRTLLRLGLYEIKYYEETPDRVALNEIIDIAKKYSDKTSAKFINGLLSRFIKEES